MGIFQIFASCAIGQKLPFRVVSLTALNITCSRSRSLTSALITSEVIVFDNELTENKRSA